MLHRKMLLVAAIVLCSTQLGEAADTKVNRISVKLFGTPCSLEGPKDQKILKAIHEVSPEQLPPPQSLKDTELLLMKLAHLKPAPQGLERYLDLFEKHLSQVKTFFEAFEKAKAQKNGKLMVDAVKALVPNRNVQPLEAEVAEFAKSTLSDEARERILLSAMEILDPRPESEFHHVIKQMKVQYQCSFEGGE